MCNVYFFKGACYEKFFYLCILFLLMLSSCGRSSVIKEEKIVENHADQIVSAIKNNDGDFLKSIFSERAISEADSIESQILNLFNFVEGDITSYKVDGWSSDESRNNGKRSLMIRYGINIETNKNSYFIFVFDYSTNTMEKDLEGIYKIEIREASYDCDLKAWQERMYAGVEIFQ